MPYQRSPLHVAAQTNDFSFVKNNPIRSADLLAEFLGNTPLLWSIANSSIKVALLLLDHEDKAQVNTKSTNEMHLNTPLILSVSKGANHSGQTPSDSAISVVPNPTHYRLIKKLLLLGARVNDVDAYGRSALHYACLHRCILVIGALVNAGASWDIKDCNNLKPLDFCCMDEEMARDLLDNATGGESGYTYTLERNVFRDSEAFYIQLSQLLAGNNKSIDLMALKNAYELNKKVELAIAPLYRTAQSIFFKHAKRESSNDLRELSNEEFRSFAQNQNLSTDDDDYCFQINNPTQQQKFRALVRLHDHLRHVAAADTDSANKELTLSTKRKKMLDLVSSSLTSTDSTPELDSVHQVSVYLINLILQYIALMTTLNHCVSPQLFLFAQPNLGDEVQRNLRSSCSFSALS